MLSVINYNNDKDTGRKKNGVRRNVLALSGSKNNINKMEITDVQSPLIDLFEYFKKFRQHVELMNGEPYKE